MYKLNVAVLLFFHTNNHTKNIEHAGLIFLPNEVASSMFYSHTEICKPESLDDERYKSTRTFILQTIIPDLKEKDVCRADNECDKTELQRIMNIENKKDREFELRRLIGTQEEVVVSLSIDSAKGWNDAQHSPSNILEDNGCDTYYRSKLGPPDRDYIIFNIDDHDKKESLIITKIGIVNNANPVGGVKSARIFVGDATKNEWQKVHKIELENKLLQLKKTEQVIEAMFVVEQQTHIKLVIDDHYNGKYNELCRFKVYGVVVE